ncbi:AP-4 complex subunit sigma [Scenedesmus sp. PABB004]|nr:AP-4 complex subunit sigma [Scenedesmus sp. PABB004]
MELAFASADDAPWLDSLGFFFDALPGGGKELTTAERRRLAQQLKALVRRGVVAHYRAELSSKAAIAARQGVAQARAQRHLAALAARRADEVRQMSEVARLQSLLPPLPEEGDEGAGGADGADVPLREWRSDSSSCGSGADGGGGGGGRSGAHARPAHVAIRVAPPAGGAERGARRVGRGGAGGGAELQQPLLPPLDSPRGLSSGSPFAAEAVQQQRAAQEGLREPRQLAYAPPPVAAVQPGPAAGSQLLARLPGASGGGGGGASGGGASAAADDGALPAAAAVQEQPSSRGPQRGRARGSMPPLSGPASLALATATLGGMMLWKLLTGEEPAEGPEDQQAPGPASPSLSPGSAATGGAAGEHSAVWTDASSQCGEDEAHPPGSASPSPQRGGAPRQRSQAAASEQADASLHPSDSFISAASLEEADGEQHHAPPAHAGAGAVAGDGGRNMRRSSSEQVEFGAIEPRLCLGAGTGLGLGAWQDGGAAACAAPLAALSLEEDGGQQPAGAAAAAAVAQQQRVLRERKLQPLDAAAADREGPAMTDAAWASLRTVQVDRAALPPRTPAGGAVAAAAPPREPPRAPGGRSSSGSSSDSDSDDGDELRGSAFALPPEITAAGGAAPGSTPHHHSRHSSRGASGLSGSGSLFASLGDWPSIQLGTRQRSTTSAEAGELEAAAQRDAEQPAAAAAEPRQQRAPQPQPQPQLQQQHVLPQPQQQTLPQAVAAQEQAQQAAAPLSYAASPALQQQLAEGVILPPVPAQQPAQEQPAQQPTQPPPAPQEQRDAIQLQPQLTVPSRPSSGSGGSGGAGAGSLGASPGSLRSKRQQQHWKQMLQQEALLTQPVGASGGVGSDSVGTDPALATGGGSSSGATGSGDGAALGDLAAGLTAPRSWRPPRAAAQPAAGAAPSHSKLAVMTTAADAAPAAAAAGAADAPQRSPGASPPRGRGAAAAAAATASADAQPRSPSAALVIGRNPTAWASIPDQEISGRHACLSWSGDLNCWQLADAGSLNGTLLNGTAISKAGRLPGCPAALRHGDTVELGSATRARVECSPCASASQPAAMAVAAELAAAAAGTAAGRPAPQHAQLAHLQQQLGGTTKRAGSPGGEQAPAQVPAQALHHLLPERCAAWTAPASPPDSHSGSRAACAAGVRSGAAGGVGVGDGGGGRNPTGSSVAGCMPKPLAGAAGISSSMISAGPASPGALLAPLVLLRFLACRVEGAVVKMVGADHRRNHCPCEDVVAWRTPLGDRPQVGLFCIFDGHHSRVASEQAQELLPQLLSERLPAQQQAPAGARQPPEPGPPGERELPPQRSGGSGSGGSSGSSGSGGSSGGSGAAAAAPGCANGHAEAHAGALLADEASVAAALTASFLEADRRLCCDDGCTATALLLECAPGARCSRAPPTSATAWRCWSTSAGAPPAAAAAGPPGTPGRGRGRALAPAAASSSPPARLRAPARGRARARAAASAGWRSLTEDHRIAVNAGEAARLSAKNAALPGGVSSRLYGLNISRMLGDRFLKEADVGFSAEPHVSEALRLGPADEALLLAASDGLWDVVPPPRAAALAAKTAARAAAAAAAGAEAGAEAAGAAAAPGGGGGGAAAAGVAAAVAEALMHAALGLRSKDDISILVLHVLPADVAAARAATAADGACSRDSAGGAGWRRAARVRRRRARSSSRGRRAAAPTTPTTTGGRAGGMTIKFLLLVNKQGQTRLAKYFTELLPTDEKRALEGEVVRKCLARTDRQCSFFEHRAYKIVYRRYASLFFMVGVDDEENELAVLELIHCFVEVLDKHFGQVCELDIMNDPDVVHYIMDEMLLNGCIVDTNKCAASADAHLSLIARCCLRLVGAAGAISEGVAALSAAAAHYLGGAAAGERAARLRGGIAGGRLVMLVVLVCVLAWRSPGRALASCGAAAPPRGRAPAWAAPLQRALAWGSAGRRAAPAAAVGGLAVRLWPAWPAAPGARAAWCLARAAGRLAAGQALLLAWAAAAWAAHRGAGDVGPGWRPARPDPLLALLLAAAPVPAKHQAAAAVVAGAALWDGAAGAVVLALLRGRWAAWLLGWPAWLAACWCAAGGDDRSAPAPAPGREACGPPPAAARWRAALALAQACGPVALVALAACARATCPPSAAPAPSSAAGACANAVRCGRLRHRRPLRAPAPPPFATMRRWLLALACLAAAAAGAAAVTAPDQFDAVSAVRDALASRSPNWAAALSTWTCPTDAGNSVGACDPCGNTVEGNWFHMHCRGNSVGWGESGDGTRDGLVTNVHITDVRLDGPVPRELCALRHVREFDLDGGHLTGPIPHWLGECFPMMEELDLSYNRLTGTLPAYLADLPVLSEVKVEDNTLIGTIPPELGRLKLRRFQVELNDMTGPIPASFRCGGGRAAPRPPHPAAAARCGAAASPKPQALRARARRNVSAHLTQLHLADNDFSGNLSSVVGAHLSTVTVWGNPRLCGMVPATVRYAKNYNPAGTRLGQPC